MLSEVLLLSAAGTAIRGLFCLRREKYFARIFRDVDQMPVFNADYMLSHSDLPDQQFVLLCAKLASSDPSSGSSLASHPPPPVLFSAFFPTGRGKMFKTTRVELFHFRLDSAHDIRLHPPSRNDILLYSLPSLSKDIPARWWNLPTTRYTEYAITPEKHVCPFLIHPTKFVICGQVFQQHDHAIIKPLIVSGENKEGFLDYLDTYLMRTRKNTEYSIAATLTLIALHALLFKKEK